MGEAEAGGDEVCGGVRQEIQDDYYLSVTFQALQE